MSPRQPVIFCDFDGTITVNDNIIAIMKHFNPEGWERLLQDLLGGSITLQEAVGSMFALFPVAKKEEVVRFALDNMQIRPGFAELLAYCRKNGIIFLVTSGGIDFFVRPTLEPFGIGDDNIFCNGSDFSGDRIRILWPHSCDDQCDNGGCGMCKTAVIRAYPTGEYHRILIGDSLTDFAGAKLAETVFARSHLIEQCRKLNMPFYPFDDFYDVRKQLETILQEEAIRP